MTVIEVIEENQDRLRLLDRRVFNVEEAFGTIRVTYKHGGIFITNGGFIKLWTQSRSTVFYHEATFETTEQSKPFKILSSDLIDLGNSSTDTLRCLIDRFRQYGYEDYSDAY